MDYILHLNAHATERRGRCAQLAAVFVQSVEQSSGNDLQN